MDNEQLLMMYAKKTFRAQENRYGSVVSCDTTAFDQVAGWMRQGKRGYYTGVKQTPVITAELQHQLAQQGFFVHTKDVMSDNGRAICHGIQHPLTLKPMTGSSGGTAMNVFLGLNDLGVGTDGGGSVLCPALSLNLYSVITKAIPVAEQFQKTSTDQIAFTPAVGFMAQNLELLSVALEAVQCPCTPAYQPITVAIPKKGTIFTPNQVDIYDRLRASLEGIDHITVKEIPFPDVYGARQQNIDFLTSVLDENTIVLTFEGPIDYYGMGDSLFGLMDEFSAQIQRASGKGLSRVANMVGANAMTIPSSYFSTGFVLMTKMSLGHLFALGQALPHYEPSELLRRYFQ